MSYEFHPIAAIFPLLEGNELEALTDDIKTNGLREPAWLYEGKILDGRNRATACLLGGVKLTTREFNGSRADALSFVWSENFTRRHLDAGKSAAVVILRQRMEEEFAAEVEKIKDEADKRKKAGLKQGKEKPAPVTQQIGERNRHERETDAVLAKASGTNRTYLQAGAKLDTTTLEAVRDGKQQMSKIVREQQQTNKKPTPIADTLFRAFKELSDRIESIIDQFGGVQGMLDSKAWKQCDTGAFRVCIKELAEKLGQWRKEMEHANRKSA